MDRCGIILVNRNLRRQHALDVGDNVCVGDNNVCNDLRCDLSIQKQFVPMVSSEMLVCILSDIQTFSAKTSRVQESAMSPGDILVPFQIWTEFFLQPVPRLHDGVPTVC